MAERKRVQPFASVNRVVIGSRWYGKGAVTAIIGSTNSRYRNGSVTAEAKCIRCGTGSYRTAGSVITTHCIGRAAGGIGNRDRVGSRYYSCIGAGAEVRTRTAVAETLEETIVTSVTET